MSPRRKLNTPGGALLRIQILFNYFQIMLIEALSDHDKQTTPPHTLRLPQPLVPIHNQMNKRTHTTLGRDTLGKERSGKLIWILRATKIQIGPTSGCIISAVGRYWD